MIKKRKLLSSANHILIERLSVEGAPKILVAGDTNLYAYDIDGVAATKIFEIGSVRETAWIENFDVDDFDGDGTFDITLSLNPKGSNNGSTAVYKNFVSKSILEDAEYSWSNYRPRRARFVDVNQDGLVDIYDLNNTGYDPVYETEVKSGPFFVDGLPGSDLSETVSFVLNKEAAEKLCTEHETVFLKNNKRRYLDIVIAFEACRDNYDGILHGTANDSGIYSWTTIGPIGKGIEDVAVADINNDGIQDILAVYNGGYLDNGEYSKEYQLSVHKGDLEGVSPNSSVFSLKSEPISIDTIDWNNDGKLELLVGSSESVDLFDVSSDLKIERHTDLGLDGITGQALPYVDQDSGLRAIVAHAKYSDDLIIVEATEDNITSIVPDFDAESSLISGSGRQGFKLLKGTKDRETIKASGKISSHLIGEDGNDRLIGSNRDDVIDGGRGNDKLKGRRGADVFVLSPGKDKYLDLKIKEGDTIEIDGGIEYRLASSKKGAKIIHDEGYSLVKKLKPEDIELIVKIV